MDALRASETFRDAVAVADSLRPTSPVYCLRPHTVRELTRRFVRAFPGETLYAVKCNPHPRILDAVRAGGVDGFDTASIPEIAQIAGGWPEAEAFYMNPVRPPGAATTARRTYGVCVFALDHMEELAKLRREVADPGEVVAAVRIAPPTTGARMDLACKFGAGPSDAVALLQAVREAGMQPGIAFHVGSQCVEPESYTRALRHAGDLAAGAGVKPVLLDVGGGFPAPYTNEPIPPITAFTDTVRQGLGQVDTAPGCRVLAEPGRAITAAGASLLVQVHLRAGGRLHINDGVFGSLAEIEATGIRPPVRVVRPDGPPPTGAPRVFDAAGPTCDSVDMIQAAFTLPDDVSTGDWLELDCMGAYTNASASRFNGFDPCTFVEVADPPPCVPAP